MKKYRLLIYIISCFILGFLFTYLVYLGLWERLIAGFSSVPFWLYILLLPVAFYVTLTLHELGHLIAFRMLGIKIRALYLTIFVFYKDQKGWHFTVKPKLWILFGGMVIPDFPPVKDDEDYQKLTSIFAKSLMAAPIVTIVFMIMSIITFYFAWIFGSFVLWFGILTVFMIYTVLLSSFYIYTFKLNTKHLYGDFVAYKKMNDDLLFQFAEIFQYQAFSLYEDKGKYLYHKATALIESVDKINNNMFMLVTMMAYLEGVIHEGEPVSDKINQLLTNIPINGYVKTEEGLAFIYMLAEYHYHQGHVEKAYTMIERAHKYAGKRLDDKLKTYVFKRAEHVMHIAYHDDFLSDNENIYIGQGWLFEAIEDPYELAKKEHELLPFQMYICDIPETKEKMPEESDIE